MKTVIPTIAATAGAMASSMAYALPPELLVQSVFPQTREEVSQMIIRPKNQIELAKNLKFILDHDLELKDDFYTESSLIDAFNLDEVIIDKTDNENGDIRVSVISNRFSAIFPKRTNSGGTNFVPTVHMSIGKTTHSTGLISAGINFGMDEGGPKFDETWKIFGNEFTKLDPLFPGTYGGPLPARAFHGNESWRRKWVSDNLEKTLTLSFNRDAELSNILIEVKNKVKKGG
ncbi:MAG TPA: hypothetical protein VGP09_10370 [Caballeronia sp.]|jgi:hypothetical protein|nr:hypothetical protein [Caballeronia sp.]